MRDFAHYLYFQSFIEITTLKVSLGEICEITNGHPFRGRIAAAPGSGVRVIQMKDVTSNGEIRMEEVIEAEPETGKPVYLLPGQILLAARGNRNYAIQVPEAPEDQRFLAAPHWFVIRCTSDAILPEFLCWQLNRRPAQQWFETHAMGSVTKVLRRKDLAETPIAVPPLDKQQAFIGIARSMYQERRLCERLMTETETMNDGLARQLLADI